MPPRRTLSLCPKCQQMCADCQRPLRVFAYCPPCAGRKGGQSRSQKKRKAARQNVARAREELIRV